MAGDFKGTVFQKNRVGVICLLRMNSLKIIFDSFYLDYIGWIKTTNHLTLLSLLNYSKMASYDFWLRLQTSEVDDDKVSDKREEAVLLQLKLKLLFRRIFGSLQTYEVGDDEVSDKPEEAALLQLELQ